MRWLIWVLAFALISAAAATSFQSSPEVSGEGDGRLPSLPMELSVDVLPYAAPVAP